MGHVVKPNFYIGCAFGNYFNEQMQFSTDKVEGKVEGLTFNSFLIILFLTIFKFSSIFKPYFDIDTEKEPEQQRSVQNNGSWR